MALRWQKMLQISQLWLIIHARLLVFMKKHRKVSIWTRWRSNTKVGRRYSYSGDMQRNPWDLNPVLKMGQNFQAVRWTGWFIFQTVHINFKHSHMPCVFLSFCIFLTPFLYFAYFVCPVFIQSIKQMIWTKT